jgi:hypothetical protein
MAVIKSNPIKPIKDNPIQTRTPLQSSIIDKLSGLNATGSQEMYDRVMGDPYKGFAPIRQGALQSFDKSVPTLAQRFTDMKTDPYGYNQFSSGIQGGRSGLESSLGALGEQYGMNSRDQQMGLLRLLLGQGMQPQFEPVYKTPQQNGWFQAAGAGFSMLPHFFGK